MIDNIIYLAGNAFRIFIYWKLLNAVFKNAKPSKLIVTSGFILYFLVNSILFILLGNFTVNVLTNIVPLFLLSFMYSRKIKSVFFVTIAFYSVNMMADLGMYAISLIIGFKSILISSGLGSVLFTFLLELVFESALKKKEQYELDIAYFIEIISIPIGSIIIGILTLKSYDVKAMVISSILILFNIMVIYIYEKLQKTYEALSEKQMLEQAVEAQHNELEIVKSSQDKVDYLRHDFKNHLIIMGQLVADCKYSELSDYISKSVKSMTEPKQFINTGFSEIDSIMNFKLQEIDGLGTKMKYSISIPEKLKIDGFDIIVVLGNLLNNAIEALEKTKDKTFFIDVTFEKNILFIHIENSFDGIVKKNDKDFVTTKASKSGHGIGLKSVNNILEKYNGDIIFSYDNNVFKTDAMLCNVECKK